MLRVTDDEVIVCCAGSETSRFRWDEVLEVVTFKRDFGSYDDIRLAFRLDEVWVEVSEESEGWSTLAEAMAKRIPGIPAEWYSAVMFPAFETIYRVLFRKG